MSVVTLGPCQSVGLTLFGFSSIFFTISSSSLIPSKTRDIASLQMLFGRNYTSVLLERDCKIHTLFLSRKNCFYIEVLTWSLCSVESETSQINQGSKMLLLWTRLPRDSLVRGSTKKWKPSHLMERIWELYYFQL